MSENQPSLPPLDSVHDMNAVRVRKYRVLEEVAKMRLKAWSAFLDNQPQDAINPSNQDLNKLDPRILEKATIADRMELMAEKVKAGIPESQTLVFLKVLRMQSFDASEREFFCECVLHHSPQILEKIVSLLDRNQPVQVLKEATWTLINMSSSTTERIDFRANLANCEPLLTALIELLFHRNLEVRHQAIWIISNLLSDAMLEPVRVHFFDNTRLLDVLLHFFKKEHLNFEYIRTALWSLEILLAPLQKHTLKKINHAKDIIKAILRCSDTPHPHIFQSILKIVHLLAQHALIDTGEALTELGGFETLIQRGLNSKNISSHLKTLEIVALLLDGGWPTYRGILLDDLHVIEIVEMHLEVARKARLLDEPQQDRQLTRVCLNVLSLIPTDDQAVISKFQQYLFPFAVFFMSSQDMGVRLGCLNTVKNFFKLSHREHMDKVNLTELMEEFIFQLSVNDPEVIYIALECIEILFEFGELLKAEEVAEHNILKQMFKFLGGDDRCEALLSHIIERVRMKAEQVCERYTMDAEADQLGSSEGSGEQELQEDEEELKDAETKLATKGSLRNEEQDVQSPERKYGFGSGDLGFKISDKENKTPVSIPSSLSVRSSKRFSTLLSPNFTEIILKKSEDLALPIENSKTQNEQDARRISSLPLRAQSKNVLDL